MAAIESNKSYTGQEAKGRPPEMAEEKVENPRLGSYRSDTKLENIIRVLAYSNRVSASLFI